MAESPGQNAAWRPRIQGVLGDFATPVGVISDLERLLTLVVSWNQKMDLTAARDNDELTDLMLADAVLLARNEPEPSAHFYDVGSGAGAPGIPLALLLPKARVT